MIRAVPEFALLFTVEDTPVTTDTNRPLWRKMEVAYRESEKPGGVENWLSEHGYAAEIRALADWLVPDEPDAPRSTDGSWNAAVQMGSDAIWMQRQHLRKLLLAEADRAEAGE